MKKAIKTLKLFDVTGKEIRVLLKAFKTAGEYDILLKKNSINPGIYYYQLQVGKMKHTRKMIIQ